MSTTYTLKLKILNFRKSEKLEVSGNASIIEKIKTINVIWMIFAKLHNTNSPFPIFKPYLEPIFVQNFRIWNLIPSPICSSAS